MATLYITEFAVQGRDAAGYLLPAVPLEPPVAEQTVAIGASSAQSNAFNASTSLIRVHTDAVCSLAVGTNPTAAASNRRMAIGQTEYCAVPVGKAFKLAVITNT